MATAKATIRELRLNFRAVKRKIEEHGSIIITDNGVPSFQLSPIKPSLRGGEPLPDYYARLVKQRTKISRDEGRTLHEENRGDR
jgi:antitoxin (DNA-binding transcriptional repressor) of toxin-antitoxin stability system